MFDSIKKNIRWTDQEATLNLRLALEDSVAERERVQGLTYEDMKKSLRTGYKLSVYEARQELRRMKLRKGENIHWYADHIMKMVKRGYPELGTTNGVAGRYGYQDTQRFSGRLDTTMGLPTTSPNNLHQKHSTNSKV